MEAQGNYVSTLVFSSDRKEILLCQNDENVFEGFTARVKDDEMFADAVIRSVEKCLDIDVEDWKFSCEITIENKNIAYCYIKIQKEELLIPNKNKYKWVSVNELNDILGADYLKLAVLWELMNADTFTTFSIISD